MFALVLSLGLTLTPTPPLDPSQLRGLERVLRLTPEQAPLVLAHVESDRLNSLGRGASRWPRTLGVAAVFYGLSLLGLKAVQAGRDRQTQALATVTPIGRREVQVEPAVDSPRKSRSHPAA